MNIRSATGWSLLLGMVWAALGDQPADIDAQVPQQEEQETASLSHGVVYPGAAPENGLSQAISAASAEAQEATLRGLSHLVTFWDAAALIEFKHALQLDPDCAMAHWGLVLSTISPNDERTADKEASLRKLQEILAKESAPEKELAYIRALYMLLKEGTIASADEFLSITDRWKNDQLAPLFTAMLGRDGFDASGKPNPMQAKSIGVLDALIEKYGELHPAYFVRALIEETNPVISPKALNCAMNAVKISPDHAPSRLLYGHLLFRTGKYEQAEEQFAKASELYSRWQEKSFITSADNEGYFKSELYRAVSEFCRGDCDTAIETAKKLASLPVNMARPKAKGTLIQLWEVRSLPLKLRLAMPSVPSIKEVETCLPAPLKVTTPLISASELTAELQYADLLNAEKSGNQEKVFQFTGNLERLKEILLKSADKADQDSALSYWSRAAESCSLYMDIAKSIVFSSSADVWLDKAIEEQRYASMLMPPVMPYPAEWVKARHFLKLGKYADCVKACDAALMRFPNHAPVLETRQEAAAKLAEKNTPVPQAKNL